MEYDMLKFCDDIVKEFNKVIRIKSEWWCPYFFWSYDKMLREVLRVANEESTNTFIKESELPELTDIQKKILTFLFAYERSGAWRITVRESKLKKMFGCTAEEFTNVMTEIGTKMAIVRASRPRAVYYKELLNFLCCVGTETRTGDVVVALAFETLFAQMLKRDVLDEKVFFDEKDGILRCDCAFDRFLAKYELKED